MTFSLPSPYRALASARLSLALGAALLLAATGVQAQFKVVGADGKVTYTDREPSQPEGFGPSPRFPTAVAARSSVDR